MKNTLKSLMAASILAIVILSLPVSGMAEGTKVVMNFTKSVEIPGWVLLPGIYSFKSAANDTVQVFDAEGQLITTLMTVSSTRVGENDKPVLTFESVPGHRPTLKAFYEAGSSDGYEFVY